MVTELVKLNECCLCKSTIANKTMTKTWPLEKNHSPIKNAANRATNNMQCVQNGGMTLLMEMVWWPVK